MANDESKLTIRRFSEVPYEPPRYLDALNLFPRGKSALVQGEPGCGKTAFMCAYAAQVSVGGKILNKPVVQGNVLILSVEDDASTLRGRIEASGGDVSKCFFIENAFDLTFSDERLQDAIEQVDAKLVIFDPIQNFLGADINMNMANQTRPIMARVEAIAKAYDCAIVLVAHTGKAKDGKSAVVRSLGSTDIPGSARSVLQIGRDPADGDRCVVAHVKSSTAKKSESFTYTIGEKGGVTFGEFTTLTAYDLDTASARKARGVPYEEEPVVKVIRQLMSENNHIDCIYRGLASRTFEHSLHEKRHNLDNLLLAIWLFRLHWLNWLKCHCIR